MKNTILGIRIIIFITTIILTTSHVSMANEITDYKLHINKINQEACNLHITCSFSLNFQDADSVTMNFGGGQEFSIDNLRIDNKEIEYEYNLKSKNIVFCKKEAQTVQVKMDYSYTNLSAFFIYGEGNAELWETSFGEYYYPYVPNTYMDVTMNVETPDSISLICSYPLKSDHSKEYNGKLQNILSQSLTLAFIQNDAYKQTRELIPNEIFIYQIKDMECSDKRYKELLQLTKASIDFFSRIYGEDYISKERNVMALPTYLFHNGKGFSNRYNIGFISASQEKFSTYPDIYPLVHEIGHRWLGEWTLLINDGEPGAYFIKESLNEFMTLMFIRQFYGSESYMTQIEKCRSEYNKIKGTPQDEAIVNMVENNNNTIVYRKGPLVLDYIAKEIGYDELMKAISKFYQEYAGKYPLKYTNFIDLLNESYNRVGDKLNLMLTK